MIVDTDFLDGARTLFQALFNQLVGKADESWKTVTTVVPSGGKDKLTCNWLGAPPAMQTFIGEVQFGKMFSHDYTLTVGEQAVGIEVSRKEYKHNPLGTITLAVGQMMQQALKYYPYSVYARLSLGFSANGYDGTTFYSATHSIGDAGTHDNTGTAVLSSASPAEYIVAWKTINTAKDHAGLPMGLIPTHLVCDSSNKYEARKLLASELLSDGTVAASNPYRGDVEPLITPWLSTATEWHLLAANEMVKPVIIVEDEAPHFTAQDDPASEGAFRRKVYAYKVECSIVTGFGDFRTAYGSTGGG